MGWTHVQHPTPADVSTTVTTLAKAYGANVVAGNLLVVLAGVGNATLTFTCADTLLNTWLSTPLATGTNRRAQIFYAISKASGADTVTLTYNTGVAVEKTFWIAEFSGIDPTNPLDQTLATSGNSTNPSGNLPASVRDGDLCVAVCPSAGTITAPAAGSDLGVINGNDAMYINKPAAAGTQAMTFTQAVANAWAMAGASFRQRPVAPGRGSIAAHQAATWMRKRRGILVPDLWLPTPVSG